MPDPHIAPYGSWDSPITADLITAATIGFGGALTDGRRVFWIEMRPAEAGRYVLVAQMPDGPHDLTPPGYNVRTRVHEYGGAPACIDSGAVYFANFADQRLYRQPLDGIAEPQPLTPTGLRFADTVADPARARLIALCEDHTAPGEAVNYLAAVATDTGRVTPLARGRDFYAAPRLSPDGSQLAWLEWDHPNMPWDGTDCMLAEFGPDGATEGAHRIAGGADESIFQPCWSPDGRLYFVSDRTGWWNLYRLNAGRVEPVLQVEAELGRPHWGFGTATYGFLDERHALATVGRQGDWTLARIDVEAGSLTDLDTPYTHIEDIHVRDGIVCFEAGAPDRPMTVVRYDPDDGRCDELRRSSDAEIDPAFIAHPEAIEFPTEGGRTAHAYYYPPTNPNFRAPNGERPPLLVMSHGGPTSQTTSVLNLRRQFWTSRGIAVLDVNYGGSTGFGRDYRRRLNGQWGIVDVDDCVHGARFLVDRGDVDPARLAITGGSAGGWTTLCALTFRDTFHAGASHFGVSDATALATDTHKFESRYLDSLIGPFPERTDLYDERSPIHHTDRLNCPIAFFQGLEDEIVPPDQSERMANALRDKGLPVAYVTFPGEQHGFRQAAHIKAALEGELYFYSRIFDFDLAGSIAPIPIDNLPA